MPGHELDRPRAGGDEAEQDERLVERLRGVVVPADHVVERDDVLEALVLGGRRELADRARVVADLVLREDDADLHARTSCQCAPARQNLQNACACELLALACRHGHPRRSPTARSRRGRTRRARPRAARKQRRRPRRPASAGRGAQPRRCAHRGARGAARRGRPGALAARARHLAERGRAPVRREPLGRRAVARARRARGAPRARRQSRAHRRHPRAQPQARAHRGGRARAGARLRRRRRSSNSCARGATSEARALLERAFDWSRTA